MKQDMRWWPGDAKKFMRNGVIVSGIRVVALQLWQQILYYPCATLFALFNYINHQKIKPVRIDGLHCHHMIITCAWRAAIAPFMHQNCGKGIAPLRHHFTS